MLYFLLKNNQFTIINLIKLLSEVIVGMLTFRPLRQV